MDNNRNELTDMNENSNEAAVDVFGADSTQF